MKTMIERKEWSEFRNTGLVLIINQILHVFGWAIVFIIDDDTGKISNVYPGRVKFRGFDNKSVTENYDKIAKYLKDNSEQLYKETIEP